ncbi:dTDP-4-dehydrorhamnose reductase [Cellulophaga sp. Hel_I_12]|uniref:dTDP-4-dehydrorhamnose reductase n=1 Tax=Cellulophaga sp. Hel_I_12 TaxID=1249972 RepID=UPI000645709E|nr:dTDP-4-dehydrorhamnose reductase [Cellulophaga sp. Hel_I_12]
MSKILVTGANGQLGQCIKELSVSLDPDNTYLFKSSKDLDITNYQQVLAAFTLENFDFCINCAAYTNVDKAESDTQNAVNVNSTGAQNLATACNQTNTTLLHISTDFVFDGTKNSPYIETDKTAALSVYGNTKNVGETEIIKKAPKSYIIRTSWLYSEYGHNFMKTMIRFGSEKDSLSVINDQTGTPTYAKDLAEVLIKIIQNKPIPYGIYHYSNEGTATWFDFAKAIFEITKSTIQLHPIATEAYPLPAKRPKYSVLNSSKIKTALQLEIPAWRDSLKKAINALP